MDSQEFFHERLERDVRAATDVHFPPGDDQRRYLAELAADILSCRCKPHAVSALVMEPGLPGKNIGDVVTGVCVARRAGYWLIYDAENDAFLAFWGDSADRLGAHGVFGSAMYCWSA